ncbi:MAG TPA: hypothetical protein VIK09_05940, partial [Candidatus Humimicrobiaceae bacterium]
MEDTKNKNRDLINNLAENVGKNLDYYFGTKIDAVYNSGKDIYFEIRFEDLFVILDALKNKADF